MTGTRFELSEKGQPDRENWRRSGVHLSVSAVVFAVLCLLVMVAAVGLLAGFLPDRTCPDERYTKVALLVMSLW